MPNPENMVSVAEIARRYGCSIRTVHRMVADGRLTPAAKAPGIRGALLFDPADVEAAAPKSAAS